MGTPNKQDWPDGYKLSQQVGFKFPKHAPTPLSTLITNASKEAIDLMEMMLKYNPAKRPSASIALQHPFFQCAIPIPQSVNFDMKKLEIDDHDEERKQDQNDPELDRL